MARTGRRKPLCHKELRRCGSERNLHFMQPGQGLQRPDEGRHGQRNAVDGEGCWLSRSGGESAAAAHQIERAGHGERW